MSTKFKFPGTGKASSRRKQQQLCGTASQEASSRFRSTNWSKEEEATLCDLAGKHAAILNARLDNTVNNNNKKQSWEIITNGVNAVGGNNRNVEQVNKKYHNMRVAVKSIQTQNHKSLHKTGGGPLQIQPLSDSQTKLLQTIPAASYTGIPGGFDSSLENDDGK